MATAFAERERDKRGLDIEILTGGTAPAETVHSPVVETMAELGIDIAGRKPTAVSTDELEQCDIVATMGCSTLSLTADTNIRDWALSDPDGQSPEQVRNIREEVREHVVALFDEISETVNEESGAAVAGDETQETESVGIKDPVTQE